MKRGIVAALVLASLVSAQVAPWGLGVERGKAVLVFARGCEAAIGAAEVQAPVILILPQGVRCAAPDVRVFHDPKGLWRAIFYVEEEPRVVVLKEGQQVAALQAPLKTALARGLNQVLADDARYPPHFDLRIRPGDRLTGDLSTFTGLVVFWKEGCPWCEREREDLARLCQHLPVLLVSDTPGKPELTACTRRGDWRLYHDWGIPGAPTHVWIEKGVVRWIDLGYTERLTELVGVFTD